jgi:Zn-dependent M32 family carboxypeptidase
LQKNIYSHASSISTDDLVKKVTGESLNPIYFIDRIKKRYLKE